MRGSKTKQLRTPTRPRPGRKHGGEATVGANREHMPSMSWQSLKALRSRIDRLGRKAAGRWAGPV